MDWASRMTRSRAKSSSADLGEGDVPVEGGVVGEEDALASALAEEAFDAVAAGYEVCGVGWGGGVAERLAGSPVSIAERADGLSPQPWLHLPSSVAREHLHSRRPTPARRGLTPRPRPTFVRQQPPRLGLKAGLSAAVVVR